VKATPPTATQVRRDSRLGLISDRQPAMLLHHMRCRYLTTNIKTFLSPDAQSFTAAIKLYSEAKKTQLFQQNIRTRLVSYVQMTGEHWCVCACVCKDSVLCTHTHTHTDTGGVQTHRWERAVSSHSPGSVIEAASLKKFELFLNFSSKSAIYGKKRIRPAFSPFSFRPFLSCPFSSS